MEMCIWWMEQRVGQEIKGWPVGELAPVLLRAKSGDDLTDRRSWSFSSRLPFCDVMPGYKENDPKIDYFGVPFYAQSYPEGAGIFQKLKMAPMGWLEGNDGADHRPGSLLVRCRRSYLPPFPARPYRRNRLRGDVQGGGEPLTAQ